MTVPEGMFIGLTKKLIPTQVGLGGSRGLVPDADLPDILKLPVLLFGAFLSGWWFLFFLMGFLLYGALNNRIALLLVILAFAISLISISVSKDGLGGYLWEVWTDYTDKWTRLGERFLDLVSFWKFLIPFVNLYYDDRQAYYSLLMHHLL